jgi:hypothetical protein
MKQLILLKHSTVKTSASAYNQCKDVAHSAYDYEIEVTTGGQLDEDGFIIDHSVIHQIIVDVIQNKMGSCEQLCLRVEEDVLQKLQEHGCNVQRLVFMIKPVGSNAWVKVVGEYSSVRQVYPDPEALAHHDIITETFNKVLK